MNDEMMELDDSWIYQFEKSDKQYKHFYKEKITFVNVHCIYINENKEIEKRKQYKIMLKKSNYLSKEELISIIKNNNVDSNIYYSLFSILCYNISLEPFHLQYFLKSKEPNNQFHFLTSIKHIDDIPFQPCIYMFQDLNDIFILFNQKTNKESIDINNSISGTKKIYIHKHKNKTIKNSFKETK